MAALRYLVGKARLNPEKPDAAVLVKKLVWHLLKASENMTRSVAVTLHEESGDFTVQEIHDVAWTAGGLNSSNGTAHMDALRVLMDTDFRFSLHYGAYAEDGTFKTTGQFPHQDGLVNAPVRYTFWYGPDEYGHGGDVHVIPVTRSELESIDLKKDGLYGS